MSGQAKWDAIYTQREIDSEPAAAAVLMDNQHLLPREGHALDLACGRGGNALLMADLGLTVTAWDVSPVAIAQLQHVAELRNISLSAQVRDVEKDPPEQQSFDVIVVSFFLDRELCAKIAKALKPGGVVFYQTYCQTKINQQGPSNPAYLLTNNELVHLFSGLSVRVYREEALLGDHQKGMRNQALLVAEK
jgi:2-polyprenyl-3-methyl-5-hydroxy-6-metoxy-1,4-benzoquinol methylase